MSAKTIINAIGIILNIIGVYIVFRNSPLYFTTIDEGNASTDYTKIEQDANRKNTTARFAVYGVLVGSVLQFIANFMC